MPKSCDAGQAGRLSARRTGSIRAISPYVELRLLSRRLMIAIRIPRRRAGPTARVTLETTLHPEARDSMYRRLNEILMRDMPVTFFFARPDPFWPTAASVGSGSTTTGTRWRWRRSSGSRAIHNWARIARTEVTDSLGTAMGTYARKKTQPDETGRKGFRPKSLLRGEESKDPQPDAKA